MEDINYYKLKKNNNDNDNDFNNDNNLMLIYPSTSALTNENNASVFFQKEVKLVKYPGKKPF